MLEDERRCMSSVVYLDLDAPLHSADVDCVWLPVGKVTLVHVHHKRLLQASQVIPQLQCACERGRERKRE